jgi:hypothetical protein
VTQHALAASVLAYVMAQLAHRGNGHAGEVAALGRSGGDNDARESRAPERGSSINGSRTLAQPSLRLLVAAAG